MLSIREAALRLGISPDAVYELCRAGRLAHYRLGVHGGRLMIAEPDLAAYLESCRVEAATARPRMTLRHVRPQRQG